MRRSSSKSHRVNEEGLECHAENSLVLQASGFLRLGSGEFLSRIIFVISVCNSKPGAHLHETEWPHLAFLGPRDPEPSSDLI